MKKLFLLSTAVLLFSGVSFAQTGKDGKGKAKDNAKDSTAAVKKPMPNCPGKTCGKKKSS
jgi:hypothetical protein